jgi:hypothetical protein
MKINFYSILLIGFFLFANSFAQLKPESYYIGNEINRLAKSLTSGTISNNSINDMITSGDTIWIATSNGVSLSTNNGNTWTNFNTNDVFSGQSVSAIGYNNGIFWAATANNVTINNQTLPQGSGLKYTSDFGQTWTSIPEPVDLQSDTIVIYGNNKLRALPVTVTVQNLIYDIAFTKGTIWIATFAGGLRKAPVDSLLRNPNYHWQRAVLPPDYLNSIKPSDSLNFCMTPVSGSFCDSSYYNYRVFSIVAANDSTLYVGTADGINKSTDNGISWQKFTHQNQTNPITGNFVVALAYNNYNNTIWAATWQANDTAETYGISFSSDGGNTWKTGLSGEHVHNFGLNMSKVVAPSDDGAFGSSDNGSTWSLPGTIQDNLTKLSLSTNTFYAAGFNGNYLWLGSDDGLARLQNNGGGIWSGIWKLFFASVPLQSSSDTYAYPNPFNPNMETLKIIYSTKGKAVPVTIRILDFGMHFVRTIIQNATRGGSSYVINEQGDVSTQWDGKDQSGNIVPNGVYFYRVDAGSMKPVFGKILVIH